MENYKWIDSMAACFGGTSLACENWATKLITERGWVRNENVMFHHKSKQVMVLVADNGKKEGIWNTDEDVAQWKASASLKAEYNALFIALESDFLTKEYSCSLA